MQQLCNFVKISATKIKCTRCHKIIPSTVTNVTRKCGKSKVATYATALLTWQQKGRPVRSDEEVQRISDLCCKVCKHFQDGKCNLCGCNVSDPSQETKIINPALMNKIRMATEDCPWKCANCKHSKWKHIDGHCSLCNCTEFKENNNDPRILQPRALKPVNLTGKLAICSCYFNPVGYSTRRKNYDLWIEALNHPDVFVIEASQTGSFQLPSASMRVSPKAILWHKERLLNLLIQRLPDEYDKVAWIDADVLFNNPNWIADTCEALNNYPVVQLFDHAIWLDRDGNPIDWWGPGKGLLRAGIAFTHFQNRMKDHPGLAWAGRRQWIQDHGLYDKHIIGAGDAVMALAFYGYDPSKYFNTGKGTQQEVLDWQSKVWPYIQGNVGFVPGTIRHLWHGDRVDRKYNGRISRELWDSYVPSKHIEVGDDGCYQWTKDAPVELINEVKDYFWRRREDG